MRVLYPPDLFLVSENVVSDQQQLGFDPIAGLDSLTDPLLGFDPIAGL